MSDGIRRKTTKSLRSGRKVAEFELPIEEPEKKVREKRTWESWSTEDKWVLFLSVQKIT